MNRQQAIRQHLENAHIFVRDSDKDGNTIVRRLSERSCRSSIEKAYYERCMERIRTELMEMPSAIVTEAARKEMGHLSPAEKPTQILYFEGDEKSLNRAEAGVLLQLHLAEDETIATVRGMYANAVVTARNPKTHGIIQPEFDHAKGVISFNCKKLEKYEWEHGTSSKSIIHEMGHIYLDALPEDKRNDLTDRLSIALNKDKGVSGQFLQELASRYFADIARDGKIYDQEKFTHVLHTLCGGVVMYNDGKPMSLFDWEKCPNTLGVMLSEFPDIMPHVQRIAPKFAAKWVKEHTPPPLSVQEETERGDATWVSHMKNRSHTASGYDLPSKGAGIA